MYDKQYASVAWAVSFFLFLDRSYPLVSVPLKCIS